MGGYWLVETIELLFTRTDDINTIPDLDWRLSCSLCLISSSNPRVWAHLIMVMKRIFSSPRTSRTLRSHYSSQYRALKSGYPTPVWACSTLNLDLTYLVWWATVASGQWTVTQPPSGSAGESVVSSDAVQCGVSPVSVGPADRQHVVTSHQTSEPWSLSSYSSPYGPLVLTGRQRAVVGLSTLSTTCQIIRAQVSLNTLTGPQTIADSFLKSLPIVSNLKSLTHFQGICE